MKKEKEKKERGEMIRGGPGGRKGGGGKTNGEDQGREWKRQEEGWAKAEEEKG